MTSSTANNAAAIAAAIKVVDESPATGAMPSTRRSFTMRSGGARGGETASITNGGGSLVESLRGGDANMHDSAGGFDYVNGGSALDDENPNVANDGRLKSRVRRASEGAHLSKSEGKRSSGELRCEKCGKGYKHSSCLTKHLLVHPSERLCTLTPRLFFCWSHTLGQRIRGLVPGEQDLIDTGTGGSILRNGRTPRNCSSPSIRKCSFWRQRRSSSE